MTIELPSLPYGTNDLEPAISAETIDFHYGKHHQAYVNNLNGLLDGSPDAGKSLEELIQTTEGGVFNNAAQVWNHTFYWNGMKPQGGGAPSGDLAAAIERDFGSFEAFKEAFTAKGLGLFGSGWLWLVIKDGALALWQGSNADNPLRHGMTPILTMDVWEHAYYIDYRNARPKYIEQFLGTLVNWEFAAQNLAAANTATTQASS